MCLSSDAEPNCSAGITSSSPGKYGGPERSFASVSCRKNARERNPLNVLVVYCLEMLPPNQQVLIKHAAIIGHEFSLNMLCAVLPEEHAIIAEENAESLLESGFILCTDNINGEPDCYRFQNCLMRDAIYNLMPPRYVFQLNAT